ncbi:hypothetical protein, partial [Adlercreutzia equolifaciens]|uniref:hypothetical protein n=1 Tax=Adlercreutzia equolifaciens TaxID=446660 RepID=UPI00399D48E3
RQHRGEVRLYVNGGLTAGSISPFRKTHFPTSADQNITFSKSAKCGSYIALFNHLVELVLFHTSILTSSIAQQKYLENVLF